MAFGSFQLLKQLEVGSDVYVFKLSCNSDGRAVAAATSEHSICVVDSAGFSTVDRLVGHEDAVQDLSFFQDQPSCLASCSLDGTARIWDLRNSAAGAVRSFKVSSKEVYSCSVGRADAALACAASEKVHLFDVAQGKRLRIYKDSHTDVVNHVRFHPIDNRKLLTGAEDNLVVVLDTDAATEDEAMLGVIPNEECVRSFTLVGPDRNMLCCASTTEDVRIWSLGEDFGTKRAEFLGLRTHELLARGLCDEDFDGGLGYLVEAFYDQLSGNVFLLAGAGSSGALVLFRVTLSAAEPLATFSVPSEGHAVGLRGHAGIVRSAICMPEGALLTAGEDGQICCWREGAAAEPALLDVGPPSSRFGLEPTSYAAQRDQGRVRAEPY